MELFSFLQCLASLGWAELGKSGHSETAWIRGEMDTHSFVHLKQKKQQQLDLCHALLGFVTQKECRGGFGHRFVFEVSHEWDPSLRLNSLIEPYKVINFEGPSIIHLPAARLIWDGTLKLSECLDSPMRNLVVNGESIIGVLISVAKVECDGNVTLK
ncbi:hypothetical protein Ddc_09507 [Ditylenchus destructor]|nr:hypothetical protein Ddc_09507 [Ditylenchus destructor]